LSKAWKTQIEPLNPPAKFGRSLEIQKLYLDAELCCPINGKHNIAEIPKIFILAPQVEKIECRALHISPT